MTSNYWKSYRFISVLPSNHNSSDSVLFGWKIGYKSTYPVRVFSFQPNKMKRKVVFNADVSNAVFSKSRKTDGCIHRIQNTPLVEESEIVSRNSEFQLINAAQKIALHEHHLQ